MKSNMKKIIIIVFSVCILLVAVPLGMKYAKKIHQEELFTKSAKAAMDYYDEYQKSEEEAELDKLIAELEKCYDILCDMEDESEQDMFSSEVASTISVLQAYMGNVQGPELLEKGLELIQEDMYSDAGYSMLLEFVNDNIGDADSPKFAE